jgi:hypothetical protein
MTKISPKEIMLPQGLSFILIVGSLTASNHHRFELGDLQAARNAPVKIKVARVRSTA